MNETTHYHLHKPEDHETADVAVLNENCDIIDAALHGKADLDPGTGKVRPEQLPPIDAATLEGKTTAELQAEFQEAFAGTLLPGEHSHAQGDVIGLPGSLAEKATTAALTAHTARTDNPHAVTAAQTGAATTLTLICTVPVSWTAGGGYYYQQIGVAGMLASDNPVADILSGSDNAANKLYAENWGKVQSIDTLDGAVKIWCTEAPATAFPVQFKVVR